MLLGAVLQRCKMGNPAPDAGWWAVQGLNLRPHACEACALTTELTARRRDIIL